MSTQESPAGAGLVTDVADLAAHVGEELGHTEWREMTQERVNQFAEVTDDHNFIHVDPGAREGRRSAARSRTGS